MFSCLASLLYDLKLPLSNGTTILKFELDMDTSCYQVLVLNDAIFEGTELFSATIVSTKPEVKVDPDNAETEISILDSTGGLFTHNA